MSALTRRGQSCSLGARRLLELSPGMQTPLSLSSATLKQEAFDLRLHREERAAIPPDVISVSQTGRRETGSV